MNEFKIKEKESVLPEKIDFKIKEELIELDELEWENYNSFTTHLNKASEIVKKWPNWKQNVLDRK